MSQELELTVSEVILYEHDLLRSIVLWAKKAKYSSVAFSSTSEYADPNKAIRTLTRMIVDKKFQE